MNRARVLFGSVVTVVGALLMLDYANVLDAGDVVETWWPAVIVVAGLMALWANPQHWMMPLVVTAAGVVLLLRSTDVVDSLAVAGPVLLILVGLLVIFGRGLNQRVVAVRLRRIPTILRAGASVRSLGEPKSICVMPSRPRGRRLMSSLLSAEPRSKFPKAGK